MPLRNLLRALGTIPESRLHDTPHALLGRTFLAPPPLLESRVLSKIVDCDRTTPPREASRLLTCIPMGFDSSRKPMLRLGRIPTRTDSSSGSAFLASLLFL